MTLSDRMVVMRDGRIAQQGPPQEVYARPEDTFVASFVGSPKMNLLDGEHTGIGFTLANGVVLTADQATAQGPVRLGVRPDDLLLSVAGDEAPADGVRVILIENLGPRAIVTIDARGTELTSVVDTVGLTGITEGTPVSLAVRPGAGHPFDPATGRRLAG